MLKLDLSVVKSWNPIFFKYLYTHYRDTDITKTLLALWTLWPKLHTTKWLMKLRYNFFFTLSTSEKVGNKFS